MRLAVLFEGGLLLFALLWAWILGVKPLEQFQWKASHVQLGILATIPMLVFLSTHFREPFGSVTGMRDVHEQMLRPMFAQCTLWDFALISALAGIGEEVLFRGVIQRAMQEGGLSPTWALIWASLLFGLAHAITVSYVVFATVIGAWLGWLYQKTDSLLLVSIAHGLYDFIALVVLIRLVKPVEKPISNSTETASFHAQTEKSTMQGKPEVIEVLNRALTIELTAINQYFCQAKMCEDWGLVHLYRKHYEESMGEMKHAEKIIERILFLEGNPEIGRYDTIRVGTNVQEQFENDLQLEMSGVSHYNEAVKVCGDLGDNGTREILEPILLESEEHVDWLETQLGLIKLMGIENYLAAQMGAGEGE